MSQLIPGVSLPEPSEAQIVHSLKLIEFIKDLMKDGPISFQRYMEAVLYTPGLGYYAAGAQKLGESGDFITAPEVSSLFGQTLAMQFAEILPILSKPVILELGAGSGKLACDVLLQLEKLGQLPEAYWILEVSADLKARQKACITTHCPHLLGRVVWLKGLPEEDFEGIVYANEVLDAMPVSRFTIKEGRLKTLGVTFKEDRFVEVAFDQISNDLKQAILNIQQEIDLPEGLCSEINLTIGSWIKGLSAHLTKGAMFFIDYGRDRRSYYHSTRAIGTLKCYYQHRLHDDPYIYPGLQDITADVDFTAVAEAAVACDLEVLGYTTQAGFLLGNGLTDLAQVCIDQADTNEHLKISSQMKKLTMLDQMGESFKVVGFGRGDLPMLKGFMLQDLLGQL